MVSTQSDVSKPMSANSRYAYLTGIEDSILSGNFTAAMAMMTSVPPPLMGSGRFYDSTTGAIVVDDSSSDYVVNTYFMFYTTYLNYVNGVMSCTDSSNLKYLAALCPSIYGTVVYQSHALYTAVFDELRTWNDDNCSFTPDTGYCVCKGGSRAYKGTTGSATTQLSQQYRLIPNPNNGLFVLRQQYPDDGLAALRILNELGQTVYQGETAFANASTSVNIGAQVPGVYLLLLTDKNGKSYRVKFLIQ
jgi:Secretion system C-terminal sorting domain